MRLSITIALIAVTPGCSTATTEEATKLPSDKAVASKPVIATVEVTPPPVAAVLKPNPLATLKRMIEMLAEDVERPIGPEILQERLTEIEAEVQRLRIASAPDSHRLGELSSQLSAELIRVEMQWKIASLKWQHAELDRKNAGKPRSYDMSLTVPPKSELQPVVDRLREIAKSL
jgi:hypothetical protein